MKQRENTDILSEHHEIADPAVMAITPVVSVQMVTYNHGQYLAEAIEGVIAQNTDFPIELVIGEDCSTDNTREIALDYQRRYPHLIRVIYSDHNVGAFKNDRRVFEACRGELVAFCEGDDYWVNPDKLREQVDLLSRFKNIDITFHSCYVKYEKQGKKVLHAVRSPTDKVFTLSEVIAGRGDFMPTASIMVRRSVLKSVQDWFDATKPPTGDYYIQVISSRNGGAYYLNKPMSVYRTEVDVSWTETTKQIDKLVEFERKFLISVNKLKREIPGQEEAFRRLLVSHYSGRFIDANDDNFSQMKEILFSVLRDLYESEAIVRRSSGSQQLEWQYLLKLAVDNGKTKELTDTAQGVSRQLLRVIRSCFEYGASVLRMINTNQYVSSEYEWTMANWKVEEQRSYLVARWERLRRMLVNA